MKHTSNIYGIFTSAEKSSDQANAYVTSNSDGYHEN
jgi:hypothetical protein